MTTQRNDGRNSTWALMAMAMALLLALAAPAMAAPCTEHGSSSPIDIAVRDIVVPRDIAVGTVLAEVRSPQPHYWLKCSGPNNIRHTLLDRPLRDGIMEVLDQNGQPIPGLGMRLRKANDVMPAADGRCSGSHLPLSGGPHFACRIFWTNNGVPQGGDFGYGTLTLTFVKTSPALSSARLGPQTVLTMRTDSYASIPYRITGGRMIVNPCLFDIPRNVSLGSVSTAALNNGQAGAPASFQIRVNCENSASYRLKFTPSGSSQLVAGAPGTISNSAAGDQAAKNVNVQITDAVGTPVALDAQIDHGAQPAVSALGYRARMVPAGGGLAQPGSVTATIEVSFTFY